MYSPKHTSPHLYSNSNITSIVIPKLQKNIVLRMSLIPQGLQRSQEFCILSHPQRVETEETHPISKNLGVGHCQVPYN